MGPRATFKFLGPPLRGGPLRWQGRAKRNRVKGRPKAGPATYGSQRASGPKTNWGPKPFQINVFLLLPQLYIFLLWLRAISTDLFFLFLIICRPFWGRYGKQSFTGSFNWCKIQTLSCSVRTDRAYPCACERLQRLRHQNEKNHDVMCGCYTRYVVEYSTRNKNAFA